MSNRLEQQLQFLLKIDKLKEVARRSLTTASRRRENSAEHSWHLAMMVLVLAEHANDPSLDTMRVTRFATMLLAMLPRHIENVRPPTGSLRFCQRTMRVLIRIHQAEADSCFQDG